MASKSKILIETEARLARAESDAISHHRMTIAILNGKTHIASKRNTRVYYCASKRDPEVFDMGTIMIVDLEHDNIEIGPAHVIVDRANQSRLDNPSEENCMISELLFKLQKSLKATQP